MPTVETASRIPWAAVLAGGKARRMGTDKAGIRLGQRPMIEWVWRQVSDTAHRVVAVGGPPHLAHLGVDTVADRYPSAGALGGIATALQHGADSDGPDTWMLCVACDMPFLDPRIALHLWGLRHGWDAVVPRVELGLEPLCALYNTRCLPAISAQLHQGRRRIRDLFETVHTRVIPPQELRTIDPQLRSFVNVNRPQDLNAAELAILGAA